MPDVVIIGGGVIGLTTAYELAGRGARVQLLEQGAPGKEASWAGAGMLPPGNPAQARTPEARLRAASHVRWESLSLALREETGIDNGFRRCGGLELAFDTSDRRLADEVEVWRREGVAVTELDRDAALRLEPALNPALTAAYCLPDLGQVRNPRHLKALVAACDRRGVQLISGAPVVGFERRGERVTGVQTTAETRRADRYLVAAGAWSRPLLAAAGCQVEVQPVRGQMVLLSAPRLPFNKVLNRCEEYLVPRDDGRILVGSTMEHVGFDKQNTASAIAALIAFATQVVPALGQARFERAWAGLRPGSSDGLPYLGRVPTCDNLFVATGHFRAGLQLSPATGALLAELLLGEKPHIPLEPYACDRGRADL